MRLVTLLLLLSPLIVCAFAARAVVVVAADIPPYVIRAQQGAPSGMAIEVLEEAARRLGEPLEIELMPLARALSQASHRPDLLLIVMSATLPSQRLERFLSPCLLLSSQGRQYSVTMRYLPKPVDFKRLPVWEAAAREFAGLMEIAPPGPI